jgi:hypothetical protein
MQLPIMAFQGIAHETMHSLGLQHEMIRNDRDDFLWIRNEAIIVRYSYQIFDAFLSIHYLFYRLPIRIILKKSKRNQRISEPHMILAQSCTMRHVILANGTRTAGEKVYLDLDWIKYFEKINFRFMFDKNNPND